MSNRLKHETSPYLLQHKDNAVDWYPWCAQAFEKAAAEDKPVFLSIGYSTCHWCHVMAHESFEDAEVAALLNDFVCIKVDREERPDIDAVYMTVCQALTGSGGWPLTICMTPQQKPFFAGTYFPKTARYGQSGLMELLPQILKLWHTDRERLYHAGEEILTFLNQPEAAEEGEAEPAPIRQAYENLRRSFDPVWGGFGAAPKFPSPHIVLFLMRLSDTGDSPQALAMAETTLRAMACGGMFDHIGGGFSRYSTDQKWLVPHFEKMLYDNALLILAYGEAFQRTQTSLYADIARRTADYILRELADEAGGFYCGQDADSDGVEGKYYVFTPDEVLHVLGRKDGKEFCRQYDITKTGNFEGKSIPDRIGKEGPGWREDDPRLKHLYEYRRQRTALSLDDKVLLSWNGWAIAALARAGRILDEPRYTKAAMRAQEFIDKNMTNADGRLFLRWCKGEAAQAGQLEDYAVYTLALLELYQATFAVRYLQKAVFYGKQIGELFEDRKNGGCFMTAYDGEALIARPKETYDGALPSGNSVTAMVWERLALLTGEAAFQEMAERQRRFLAGQMRGVPQGSCYALSAMMQAQVSHRELLFTGSRVPEEIAAYLRKHPAHEMSLLYKTAENEKELAQLAPFTKDYPVSEETIWYLCENGACHAPSRQFPLVD